MKTVKGFTLAEILITLAIIGVVAAIVIPGVLNSTNNNELHTALKKAYSTISQATYRMNTDSIDWDDSSAIDQGWFSMPNTLNMRNAYGKYLNYIRVDATNNIFKAKYRYYESNYTDDFTAAASNEPAAIISDGSFIFFASFQNCNVSAGTALLNIVCGTINIDVNGKKGPNMYAKDLYTFWVYRNNNAYKVVPTGILNDNLSCIKNGVNSNQSQGCTYRALMDLPLP